MVDSLCDRLSGLVLQNSSEDADEAVALYRQLANASRLEVRACFDRVDIAQLALRVDSLLLTPPTQTSPRLIDALRDIGRLLLSSSPPEEVLAPRRQAEFLRALDNCASPEARVYCVRRLAEAAAASDAAATGVDWDHGLLRRLADLLGAGDEDAARGGIGGDIGDGGGGGGVALANAASEFWLAARLDCRLLSGDLSNVFADSVCRRPEAVRRMRGLELAARMAARNPAALVAMETAGLLDLLAKDATSGSDPLLAANCLEVLGILGGCRHGLEWLHSRSGLLAELDRRLQSPAADSADSADSLVASLLRPQLMQLFGQIVASAADPAAALAACPGFSGRLLEGLEAAAADGVSDAAAAFVAMDTVGHVGGRSAAGKAALLAAPQFLTPLAAVLRRSARTEPRARALGAIRRLLTAGPRDAEASELAGRIWAGPLGLRMVELARMARLPFQEIRLEALGVMEAIASQDWGGSLLAGDPATLEYLLNRQSDPAGSHETTERKFAVVEAACRCPGFERRFDGPTQLRMRLHLKQGLYYAPAAQATVATEDAG